MSGQIRWNPTSLTTGSAQRPGELAARLTKSRAGTGCVRPKPPRRDLRRQHERPTTHDDATRFHMGDEAATVRPPGPTRSLRDAESSVSEPPHTLRLAGRNTHREHKALSAPPRHPYDCLRANSRTA